MFRFVDLACIYESGPEELYICEFKMAESGKYTFLALGDSYTIGEAVPATERWPVQLTRMLRSEGLATADPLIVAKTGWTTAELTGALASAQLSGPYDLASLLVGVNDQYRGYPLELYGGAFTTLLDQAIGLAGKNPRRVMVLSIPDWSLTPFARQDPRSPEQINAQVAGHNEINAAVSAEKGVHYIDIFQISKRAETDAGLIASDGLHPSGRQYALWAAAALPAARAIFTQEDNGVT
jgi:lysophospholipase L1-like esterase